MTKKEKDESTPYFHKGCEVEMIVGNFSIGLKSTKGESLTQVTEMAVAIYEHCLKINGNNLDIGVC